MFRAKRKEIRAKGKETKENVNLDIVETDRLMGPVMQQVRFNHSMVQVFIQSCGLCAKKQVECGLLAVHLCAHCIDPSGGGWGLTGENSVMISSMIKHISP